MNPAVAAQRHAFFIILCGEKRLAEKVERIGSQAPISTIQAPSSG